MLYLIRQKKLTTDSHLQYLPKGRHSPHSLHRNSNLNNTYSFNHHIPLNFRNIIKTFHT